MQNSIRNWWTALSLAVIAVLALQAAPPAGVQGPASLPAALISEEKTEEITGKVKTVNLEAKMLQFEGMERQIKITDSTKFSGGLTLNDLKAGDEVRIVGVLKPGGAFEAHEIHRMA